jgi:hypothetical protein
VRDVRRGGYLRARAYLFSDRPEAAKAALVADPEKAFADLSKILRKLVIHKYVPAAASWGIVLKPR